MVSKPADQVAEARKAMTGVLGKISRVQVTCLDDVGNEVITQFFSIRPGQVLTYKIPGPEDITILLT